MKLRAIIPDEPNHASSWWRIERPFAKLRALGYDVEYYNTLDATLDLDGAVVIVHRMIPLDPLEYYNRIKRLGATRILYSMDDFTINAPVLEQYLGACGGLTRGQIEVITSRIPKQIEFINLCDGIIVSTEKLGYLVEKEILEKPIVKLANAIDDDWYIERLSVTPEYHNNGSRVHIGYASGRRPEQDLVSMAEAWGIIAAKYANVHFVVAGFPHDIIDQHIPLERKIRIPFVPLDEWPKSMQVDIGCCPMQRTVFNEGKSVIKYIEYSMAGAAVVVSPFYATDVLQHVTGYIANSTEEWVDALSALIDSKYRRFEMQDNAEYEIKNYKSLNASIGDWINELGVFV